MPDAPEAGPVGTAEERNAAIADLLESRSKLQAGLEEVRESLQELEEEYHEHKRAYEKHKTDVNARLVEIDKLIDEIKKSDMENSPHSPSGSG